MTGSTSIEVSVNMVIPKETVERCLRVMEIWMSDNPDKTIVARQAYGGRITLHIEDAPWVQKKAENKDETQA